MLLSTVTSDPVDLWSAWVAVVSLAPPSKGLVPDTSLRSRTRNDEPVSVAFSRLSEADFRLPNATENLGM